MKIAAYAGAWFNGDMLDHGGLAVYAAPNPGAGLPEIEAAVDAVLADILEKGVTQQELDQARDRVTASAVYLLDSQEALARLFGTALTTGQTIEEVLSWEQDIATVTVDDIAKAAQATLRREASVTGVLLPAAQASN